MTFSKDYKEYEKYYKLIDLSEYTLEDKKRILRNKVMAENINEKIAELEEKLAEYVGRKHCIGVANGTEALQLALMAYDVGPGDAVFTSDFTYFASAGCASIIGATTLRRGSLGNTTVPSGTA